MEASMSNGIGYLRVSTDEQGASGLGLEAQRAAIQAAADRLGVELVSWHTDSGVSGAAPVEKRPGLLGAIADLDSGAVLLVAKRDRLARDPIVSAMTEQLVTRKGARLVSAAGEGTESDDPTSVLMRRMVDAFSEYERLLIGARTKAALQAKRRRGEKTGGAVPYGWRLQATSEINGAAVRGVALLVEDPAEQAVIQDVEAMRAAGGSLSSIAAELNRRGITTKRGSSWTHTQIGRVLRLAKDQRDREADSGSQAA